MRTLITIISISTFLCLAGQAQELDNHEDIRIGAGGNTGQTSYTLIGADNHQYTMDGAGQGIGIQTEGYHYAYKNTDVSADYEISCRVKSIPAATTKTEVGLIVREIGFSGGATPRQTSLTIKNGTLYLKRRLDRGGAVSIIKKIVLSSSNYEIPSVSKAWLKIRRSGHTFAAYASKDGITWDRIVKLTAEEDEIIPPLKPFNNGGGDLGDNITYGLVVTNGNVGAALSSTVFDHVNIEQIGENSNGGGLHAKFYNSSDLRAPISQIQVQPVINFKKWYRDTAARYIKLDNGTAFNASTASMRWSGYVKPKYSEPYQFPIVSKDGARCWINLKAFEDSGSDNWILVVDDWIDRTKTQSLSKEVELIAGKRYPIIIEYYSLINAECGLYWSSPSQIEQLVPSSQLFPNYTPNISSKSISAIAKNGEVTTSTSHGFVTGEQVTISGTTALNGTWRIIVTSSTKFKCENVALSSVYPAGGTVVNATQTPGTFSLNLQGSKNLRKVGSESGEVTGATSKTMGLIWQASFGGNGPRHYSVYRDTLLIGRTSGTGFTVPALNPDSTSIYRVDVSDLSSSGISSSNVSLQTTEEDYLEWPWFARDIGAAEITGAESLKEGLFTITGAGEGLDNRLYDQFRFIYQEKNLSGNEITITTRIRNFSYPNDPGALAGIMIRESVSPKSRYFAICANRREGVVVYSRIKEKTLPYKFPLPDKLVDPYWLRLKMDSTRKNFEAWVSRDGSTWAKIEGMTGTYTSFATALNSNLTVGWILSSGTSNNLVTASFDNISGNAIAKRPYPVIQWVTPLSGRVFSESQNITIETSVYGGNDGISNLKFYKRTWSSGIPNDQEITSPWNPGIGDYVLVSKATYAYGGTNDQTPIVVESEPNYIKVIDPDTDDDGMADAWEMQYFGSLNQNAGDDFDGDGYTNLDEYENFSSDIEFAIDPNHFDFVDSDHDGISDAWEILFFGTTNETSSEAWVAPQNLVANWTFDSDPAGQVLDKTKYGNDGNLIGFPVGSYQAGKKGLALNFDGVDSYVACPITHPGSESLDMKEFTINFWAKSSSASAITRILFTWMDSSSLGWGVGVRGVADSGDATKKVGALQGLALVNAGIAMQVEGISGASNYEPKEGEAPVEEVEGTPNFKDNTWHMGTISYGADAIMRVYVDGKLTAAEKIPFAWNTIVDVFNIGNNVGTWAGLLDEIQLYNKVLNEGEIGLLYKNPQEDSDNDGLSNEKEYFLGTDPGNANTDGDTIASDSKDTAPLIPDNKYQEIWVDDALPAGAITTSPDEGWNWINITPHSVSGTLIHRSALASGIHEHGFHSATTTMSVVPGDKLITYIYLDADSAKAPSQIMLEWKVGSDAEHRAYWGANTISLGTNGTASRYFMGAIPAKGKWVKLEIPADVVGLENKTVTGISFKLVGGTALWDRAGRETVGTPLITPNGGEFGQPVSVAIRGTTSGVTIYYTTDGSTPTGSSTSIPSGSNIVLTSSTTLKAKAGFPGQTLSDMATAVFTITGDQDGDGLSDEYENRYGTSSGTPDANGDIDGDGVPNYKDTDPNDNNIGEVDIVITAPEDNSVLE